jgi:hypothetical protein
METGSSSAASATGRFLRIAENFQKCTNGLRNLRIRYAAPTKQAGQPFPYPRKERAVKKSLKQILSQTGAVAFLCSVMLLSAPNLNPDFAEWLTTLVTTRTGVGADTAKLLVLVGPAIIGSVGLVANVLW